jgi:hypothetical protein
MLSGIGFRRGSTPRNIVRGPSPPPAAPLSAYAPAPLPAHLPLQRPLLLHRRQAAHRHHRQQHRPVAIGVHGHHRHSHRGHHGHRVHFFFLKAKNEGENGLPRFVATCYFLAGPARLKTRGKQQYRNLGLVFVKRFRGGVQRESAQTGDFQ